MTTKGTQVHAAIKRSMYLEHIGLRLLNLTM